MLDQYQVHTLLLIKTEPTTSIPILNATDMEILDLAIGKKQYTYTGDKFNATNTDKLNTSTENKSS